MPTQWFHQSGRHCLAERLYDRFGSGLVCPACPPGTRASGFYRDQAGKISAQGEKRRYWGCARSNKAHAIQPCSRISSATFIEVVRAQVRDDEFREVLDVLVQTHDTKTEPYRLLPYLYSPDQHHPVPRRQTLGDSTAIVQPPPRGHEPSPAAIVTPPPTGSRKRRADDNLQPVERARKHARTEAAPGGLPTGDGREGGLAPQAELQSAIRELTATINRLRAEWARHVPSRVDEHLQVGQSPSPLPSPSVVPLSPCAPAPRSPILQVPSTSPIAYERSRSSSPTAFHPHPPPAASTRPSVHDLVQGFRSPEATAQDRSAIRQYAREQRVHDQFQRRLDQLRHGGA